MPEVQVFLNDLPGNDFNTILNAVPDFTERMHEQGSCRFFVSVTAGSFYDRLFPKESLHFLCCANSLHWLSQVPPSVQNKSCYINKGEIAVGKTSDPTIFKAYLQQFKNDFTSFLKLRSQEIIPGGHAILTLRGRRTKNPFAEDYSSTVDIISFSLRELIYEGLIDEEKMDSFNLPIYEPHISELEEIIRDEGSFDILHLEEGHEATRLGSDEDCSMIDHKIIAKCVRAVYEAVLASHFGEMVMDALFEKFEDKLLQREVHAVMVLFVSLARKS